MPAYRTWVAVLVLTAAMRPADGGRTAGAAAVLGRCELRTPTGSVRCALWNRGERPDETGVVRLTWTNRGGRRCTSDVTPRRGWTFRTWGVRLQSVPLASRRDVIAVSVVFKGGSGSSFLSTLLELSASGCSAKRLGHVQGELPGGYMFLPRQRTLLVWCIVWRAGEAHDGPHHFRLVAYRLGPAGLARRWAMVTRREYPYYLGSESRYRIIHRNDPLREVGLRWPQRWTERWRSRASHGVAAF